MKKTTIYCDLCGKEDAHEVCFAVGRRPDPAGSTDTDTQYLDLCQEHMYLAYRMSIDYATADCFGYQLQNRVFNYLDFARKNFKVNKVPHKVFGY